MDIISCRCMFVKITLVGTGKMVLPEVFWLFKHEDLGFESQNTTKPGVVACICNPSTRKQRQEHPWRSLSSQSGRISAVLL